MKHVLNEIKELLRPKKTPNLKLYKTLEETVPESVEVFLGGSFAKKTHIKNDFDIDIFVKFPNNENISEKLKNILEKANIEYTEIPGSRNYFEVQKDYTYEIVPVKAIQSPKQAENVIDLSPFHVEYFNKNATNKTRDEVRLLKQFLKANNLYGSETHIQGFSGHSVDLLILHYDTFKNVLENASGWKDKIVIDTKNIHEFPLMVLNKSKLQSPLVIVDPTDPYRNAAAALSTENFQKFRELCKEFLKKPGKTYFKPKPLLARIPKKHKENTYIIEITPLKRTQSISAAKAKKAYEHIKTHLDEYDFNITYTDWHYDKEKTNMIISVQNNKLSTYKQVQGPPTKMKEHVKKFKKSHKNVRVKDNHVLGDKERRFKHAKKTIKHILQKDYVQACFENAHVKTLKNT